MSVVAMVPYWRDYTKLVSSHSPADSIEFQLSGKHVLNYVLSSLKNVGLIDDIVLFSSEHSIELKLDDGLGYTFCKRPTYLDAPDIRIEDIIYEFVSSVKSDYIVLAHPNCPFLTINTIIECIECVTSEKSCFDSAFVAQEVQRLAWFRSKPLNYSLSNKTPHSENLDPIIIECSALYVFPRQLFLDTGSRIGKAPYIKIVDQFEGLTLTSKEDAELAELVIDSGMVKH
jgi:CMP-N-acetylneuraminic acid synthetase